MDIKMFKYVCGWAIMLQRQINLNVPGYLIINIIRNYFEVWLIKTVIVLSMSVTTLGSLLFIFYNPFLRLNFLEGVEATSYEDDLAIIG